MRVVGGVVEAECGLCLEGRLRDGVCIDGCRHRVSAFWSFRGPKRDN